MTNAKPTGTILDRILETKRDEVAALLSRETVQNLAARCAGLPPTRGFARGLYPSPPAPLPEAERGEFASHTVTVTGEGRDRNAGLGFRLPPLRFGEGGRGGGVSLIAEIKKASPSKGVIRADFDPVAIARAYQAGGAACLSILTDERYFQGHLSYLQAVRDVVDLPILRKDFIINAAQIYEARVAGADAILLIVAALPDASVLRALRETAESVGLDVLVEVHDEAELELAVGSGASLIGVNNRSLHTFEVRLETTERLLPLFPSGVVAVAESGIFTPADVARVQKAGARAILVGESLMRADDVEAATRALLAPLPPNNGGF